MKKTHRQPNERRGGSTPTRQGHAAGRLRMRAARKRYRGLTAPSSTAKAMAAWITHHGGGAVQIGFVPALMVRLSLVLLWTLILLLSWVPAASGQEQESQENTVLDLSLEELLDVEITSVSKKAEKRSEAAAAIYVLTSEDIRRSGAKSIPDLLRTVPGINVAQSNSSRWSVTSRGFASRFANKLLVLIDGRTVYTPFFSGVYWEAKDVMLEDVDRIEIIRGPGGTLWGANAVNGVINIVTKSASQTQGGLLNVGGGTEEQGFGALRYGGKVGDLGHYRVYGKYFTRDQGGDFFTDSSFILGPGQGTDDWQMGRLGFRMDLEPDSEDLFTIQGDIYSNRSDITQDLTFITDDTVRRIDSTSEYGGGNVLARWTRRLSDTSEIQLQGYWDYYRTNEFTTDEQRHTFDLDFQHQFAAGDRHEIVWGLGYRLTIDDFEETLFVGLTPDSRRDQLFSGFVQDQIDLTDTLRLTLGTKIEHNDYTGIEIQPSGRMAWSPNDRHTVWGAVSRAVRTPSRSDHDLRLVLFPSPISSNTLTVLGSDDFDSEELLAFELGYRVRITDRIALDIAGFYNDYDNLRFSNPGTPVNLTDPVPHTTVPLVQTNLADAETYGVEIAADLQLRPWWLVRASYSLLEMNVTNAQIGNVSEGEAPQNQFSLQSRMDLPKNMELDATVRYVDDLPDLNIDSYVTMDLRWAWMPRDDLEISVVGRNLLEDEHFEFLDIIGPTVPTAVERGVYAQLTWKF